MDQPDFRITKEVGVKIQEWCNQGEPVEKPNKAFIKKIYACKTIAELTKLYNEHPDFQESHHSIFTDWKKALLSSKEGIPNNLSPQNQSNNGNGSSQ
jgi:hypothetical protein